MEPWSPVTALIGVLIIVITVHDHLKTVITVSGGGPVTSRINVRLWNLALRLAGRHLRPPNWLQSVGPALAVLTLLVWLAGLWVGWTLVFSAGEQVILESKSGTPASFVERIYYAGYTLTTLGPGDYSPRGGAWLVVTVLATVNGLFMFTMAITYIVPIITATAQQRQAATLISGLGSDPSDLLIRSWQGGGFAALEQHLVPLTSMISGVRQYHLAYPILHFFHSNRPEASLPVQIGVLDETLSLLAHGVGEQVRPALQIIEPLRCQITGHLDTLGSAKVGTEGTVPPAPALDRCAEAGIPMREPARFHDALGEDDKRRIMLRQLVIGDGWRWEQISRPAMGE